MAVTLGACDSGTSVPPPAVDPQVKGEQTPEEAGADTLPQGAPDSPVPDPSPDPLDLDYSPDSALPALPSGLADRLARVHEDLKEDIGAWLEEGGEPGGLSRRITLKSLFQQRIYRTLTQNRRIALGTLRRLPEEHARTAEDIYAAGYGLSSGLTPLKPPIKFKTYAPASPHVLRNLHMTAGGSYGIPWEVLAAVNLVETRFGRILGPSSAGALGPMQFLPSTWEQYGNGGNIMDPRDSIFAAARYLAASGGRTNIGAALFQYNRSDDYVSAVRLYARVMKRDPYSFYSFYNWQVFVRTTRGDKQLTGPGSDYPR